MKKKTNNYKRERERTLARNENGKKTTKEYFVFKIYEFYNYKYIILYGLVYYI